MPMISSLTHDLIATFRYQVIAPLVSRSLSYGEQRALVAEIGQQRWPMPDGTPVTISPRTVYRWLAT